VLDQDHAELLISHFTLEDWQQRLILRRVYNFVAVPDSNSGVKPECIS